MDQRSPLRGPSLPRDFLAEIEQELELAQVGARESRERLAQLTVLRDAAAALVDELGRSITLLDFVSVVADEIERRRRLALVGELRRAK